MKTKIVTSFYSDIPGFPFYGHSEISRHERYLHSLRSISNTNEEIICYCNETQERLLNNYLTSLNIKNVTVKVSNLRDYPHAKEMEEIKKTNSRFNFYHEVDWNKLYLISKEIDLSYDYIYWMDVGISHRGLFLLKYNPFSEDRITGLSKDYENYYFTGVFNQNLFPKINNWVGDKLINLSNTLIAHNTFDLNSTLDETIVYRSQTIGGILGGHISKIKWFVDEFEKVISKSLSKNVILNHEGLISSIYENNQINFKTFFFDTWYHDDFWKTTPYFDNNSIKNITHFVHFFEKELGL